MTFNDLFQKHGSIRAVCDAYGLNYRTVWGWFKHPEKEIPATLAAKIAATPTGSPSLSTESGAGAAATE